MSLNNNSNGSNHKNVSHVDELNNNAGYPADDENEKDEGLCELREKPTPTENVRQPHDCWVDVSNCVVEHRSSSRMAMGFEIKDSDEADLSMETTDGSKHETDQVMAIGRVRLRHASRALP